jgi:hypothetical protein
MHDFPLEQLGPRAFEQLTVALSLQVLGSGVSAFGAGRDGGREASYQGPVNWSATSDFGEGSWDGYIVIQAKQRENPTDPKSNAAWLKGQIDNEFASWLSDSSNRGKFPEYIIFVTNVRLSSVPVVGGIDLLNDHIHDWVHGLNKEDFSGRLGRRGLRGWKIWHRDQLNGLLTVNQGIRNAFPGMLTAGDILSRLSSLTGIADPNELYPVLTAHAWSSLAHERWVNFSEAGGSARKSVERVMVDLRIDGPQPREETVLREIISRGDMSLKSSLQTERTPRHIVITGQPGNGKSTLSRYITQVYRANFLSEEDATGSTAEVIESTKKSLSRLHVDMPNNCRWPVRVNLAELADDLGPGGDMSLLRWLSEKISRRADVDLRPAILKRWLRNWPWIIVLDGLDEVTSPEVRRRIMDEIEGFVEEADRIDSDLLAVVTTRPTGYTEKIDPKNFEQVDLRYLDIEEALSYGRLVTRQRLSDDEDRKEQVLQRLDRHSREPAMVRLMKTPLQVLIMTFILERLGSLPSDRYQLFWRYYETVYDRESAKNTSFASLFSDHKGAITELHESVGLALQIRSENESDARSLLPRAELQSMAEDRMAEIGYEPVEEAKKIAQKIVTVATQRLVLLVPAEDDSFTFELRSLQELMAARALTDGNEQQLRKRLAITAPSPHWRNCWIFVAGRLFHEGPDHRRDLVIEVVERFDRSEHWPGWLCPVGPELAADLLDDGLASTRPKWQKRFIMVALRAVDGVPAMSVNAVAKGLSSVLGNSASRMQIRGALKAAMSGTPENRWIASMLLFHQSLRSSFSDLARTMNKSPSKKEDQTWHPVSVADLIRPKIDLLGDMSENYEIVDRAISEMNNMTLNEYDDGGLVAHDFHTVASGTEAIFRAVSDAETSEILSLLFGDLEPKQWQAKQVLANHVWDVLPRRPVGSDIQET